MNEPTFTTQVNGVIVTCNPNLKGFKIFKKESSFIDYYAILAVTPSEGDLFIQFNAGNCVVFSRVPKEVLDLGQSAESIGTFYHKFIKGKYDNMPVDDRCIVAQKEPGFLDEDEDDDWDPDEDIDFDDDLED